MPTASKVQRHRRVRDQIEVEIVGDLVRDRALTHDLSAGGLFVDTAQEYAVGQEVRLSFTIDRKLIWARARVVHVKSMVGLGLEFVELSPIDRERILRYVHRERARLEAVRLLDANPLG